MTTRRNILRTIVLAFALVSCDATVESEYSRLRAFLRVTPVTAATPLYEAVNNPGIFCKVTLDGAHYIFTRQNGTSTQLNITAVGANYARMQSIYNRVNHSDALFAFAGAEHYLTLYEPDYELLNLVRQLAPSEGLYVWSPYYNAP